MGSRRDATLRTRWNRAFAMLILVVILSGLAGLTGTRLLVNSFRESAVGVEREATISVGLRTEIVRHSVVLASPTSALQQRQEATLERAIRAGFATAVTNAGTAGAKALLRQSLARWEVIVTAAGRPGHPASLPARGAAVSAGAPTVLALLDRAGSTSRAAVRADLADSSRQEREATAMLGLFQLLAIALALRLARRLSTEVLRPVGILRDSANHLAAGELDHRVVIDRADELGDLAVSFNAMAEAIAGTQRSLTLEANTDSLSGLPNRAAFQVRLEAALAAPNRRSGTLAVLFVDLDDFKDVNDNEGHAAGDQLLRVVAGRLRRAIRPTDSGRPSRWGRIRTAPARRARFGCRDGHGRARGDRSGGAGPGR